MRPGYRIPSLLAALAAAFSIVISTIAAPAGTALANARAAFSSSGIVTAADYAKTVVLVRAHKAVSHYTVHSGDTLTSIARKLWHHGNRWELLWWANRDKAPNPDSIRAGEHLRVPRDPAPSQHIIRAALRALPKIVVHHATRPAGFSDPVGTFTQNTNQAVAQSEQPAPAASYSGAYPGGAFGACVVAAESGGNPEVMNATGHWGLYQFSAATWAAYGGNPADFGSAGVAEQNQVFANALAQGGQSNWSPYDGC